VVEGCLSELLDKEIIMADGNFLNDQDEIKKKVLNTIAKNIGGQVTEAQQQGASPTDVINILNKLLPNTQQTVAGPEGGTIVGTKDSPGNLPAQPAIDPETEAKQILSQLVNPQTTEQQQVQDEVKKTSTGSKIFNALSFLAPGLITIKAAQQSLSGDVPLQQRDITKTILDAQLKSATVDEKAGRLTASNLLNKFELVANNFQGIFDSHQRVLASVEDPSPAGDLALIFNFMKILDPASVVREGEFANAQNSGAVPDRVRNIYNRILSGERLTNTQRGDFKDRADRLFGRKEKDFRSTEKQFKNLARRNRIDPSRVFRTIGQTSEEEKQLSNMSDDELKAIVGGQ